MKNSLDNYLDSYGKDFHYAFDNNIILNWYPKRIIKLCPSSKSLLELGIGHGFTTNLFSQHFSRHLVLDGSKAIIEKFRKQYRDNRSELRHIYFEDFHSCELFDVIVMGFILEHVINPAAILEQYKHYLSPSGRCYITVPNAESLHRRIGHAAGLLDDLGKLGSGDVALGHQRSFTVKKLTELLTEAGYKVIKTEGIFLKPLTTSQLVSLDLDSNTLEAMCTIGIDYPELCCALLVEAELAKV